MTLDAIKAEADDVNDAAFFISAYKADMTEQKALRAVRGLTEAICQASLSASSLATITQGWAGLEGLSKAECSTSITLRRLRANIMLINYAAWHWLDVVVVDQCKAILNGHDNCQPERNWLIDLTTDIETHCRLGGKEAVVLDAVNYGINLPNATCTLKQGYSCVPKDNERVNARIISLLVHVLEKWLDYPSDQASRQKAWFVHFLLTEFGTSILYLDGIWRVYSKLQDRLFVDGNWQFKSFKVIKPLRCATPDHPLFDPSSLERQMIEKMAKTIDSVYLSHNNLSINLSDPSSPALFRDSLCPELRGLADEEMKLFGTFLRQSLDYQMDRSNVASIHPKLLARLKSSPDKFLAFRELAPSRQRARSSKGPFTETVIRTTAGIFSALVWRGITFGTEFAAKGCMVFESADHFDKIRTESRKPESYFCDRAAYGRTNPGRKTALAQIYWKALQGGIWEKFVGDRILNFMECWLFFTSGHKASPFPHLGRLGAYLLTADLHYAGVVAAPTIDKLVIIIRNLNKGAVEALERLRLISPRPLRKQSKGKCNKDECRKALEYIAKVIHDNIPSLFHSRLFVDLILVEHTLCKFSRSMKKNLLLHST